MKNDARSARRFDAIIFDLDGVLVDTAEMHYQGWKRLAEELGIPFNRRKNERLKGVPRIEALKILLEDIPNGTLDLDALANRKNDYYVGMIQAITPQDLLAGVKTLLNSLRHAEIKIGVASSSKNAKLVIRNLRIGPLLDVITDGYDYRRPKPSPDLFLHCAERMGVTPARCVVVEDAQVGIEAARAAGMFAVGVGISKNLHGANMLIRKTLDFPLSRIFL